MPLVYFDSSALVKLVVAEEGSDLAAVGRNHDLSDLDTAENAWGQYWAAVRPVELTPAVEHHAGQLARSHALRGADAVHLASALSAYP
jgi:predicted nucleic acid-binding protein